MDPNKGVDSPCKLTRDWAFIGYVQDKKGPERAIPIGVYSCWANGRTQANAWMKSTPNAVRWEGERLYEPLTTEEEADA